MHLTIKKGTSHISSWDNFPKKNTKKGIYDKYKESFKLATNALHDAQSEPNNGTKGFWAVAICDDTKQPSFWKTQIKIKAFNHSG